MRRAVHPLAWPVLGLILLASAIVLLLAPAEATIGRGIHIVYVHVALIWTGLLGLVLTGLLGLAVAATGPGRRSAWMAVIGWISLAVFAAGVGTSLIAEQVNWGGIAWNEPRTAANLNLLAAATIVLVVGSWLGRPRLAGLLNAALAVAVVWTTVATELQLHPDDPIGTSGSPSIRLTFYGLFALNVLLALWIAWYYRPLTPEQEGPA